MTTHSDERPYWFTKTEMEIRNAVDTRAEQWAAVPGFSRYEWSDKGAVRRLARTDDRGRHLKAGPHATRVHYRSGYVITGAYSDVAGKVVTIHNVGQMVLLAHHPAFAGLAELPPGIEARHNPVMGPLFNCYPEGLWPGTREQNEGDKPPAVPQHECRNFALCGGLVFREGSRCVPCTEAVGREAAQLLARGANLMAVAEHFGYSGPDWVFGLAVKHGGYEGSKAAALAQHPGMMQRVKLRAAGLRLTQGEASR